MAGPTAGTAASGQFTFLFTDIEGSTRLLQALGDAAPAVIARHHELVGGAIVAAGGTVRGTRGDEFFATFPAPRAAVEAAVAAQRALAAEPWPVPDGLQVRMGLHTGGAVEIAGEWVGIDIHRAARIMSVGWGGQTLVSEQTASELGGDPADAVALRDLGPHRLKDLEAPEHIFQLVFPEARVDFPAIRTLDAVTNNLPTQLTPFIGREAQVQTIVTMLGEHRALTLTGPGGTGKTRLSLQAAAEASDRYHDGVYFVPLAGTTDPALVLSAIAGALGLHDAAGRPLLDPVMDHLRGRCTLLVLDNFEQVLPAAIDISKLLASAPRLSVLTTSRAPLRISGEQEFPVPPMTVPEHADAGLDEIVSSEAGRLFTMRASATLPDFRITPDIAADVAAIIRHLEGLPLAIELAASRVRVLPVAAIAARLGSSLDLLAAGGRDVPDRQRTLRGAIAWSTGLLDAPALALFSRMAVFRGGTDLDRLEATCGAGLDEDVFELLTDLVDHSLVRRTGTRTSNRFSMLETIREFAWELLVADDQLATMQRAHATSFLDLVEEAAPHLTGPAGGTWLDDLEVEQDNVRAAIGWATSADTHLALRFVTATWRYWQIRGHLDEARRTTDAILELDDAAEHPDEFAAALEAGGGIRYWQDDLEPARDAYQRALELHRNAGRDLEVARGLYNLGFTYGPETQHEGRAAITEALAAYDRLGDAMGVAKSRWALAVNSLFGRDFAGALLHCGACTPAFREANATFDLAWALYIEGISRYALGQHEPAQERLEEALRLFTSTGDAPGYVLTLAGFALLAEAVEDFDRSLRLFGAVDRLGEESGTRLLEHSMSVLPRPRCADDHVPLDRATTLRAEGRAMSRAEAVAYALGE